jgi:hypothetical protein
MQARHRFRLRRQPAGEVQDDDHSIADGCSTAASLRRTTMKLAIAAALLAFTTASAGTASADQLPKELLGTWCASGWPDASGDRHLYSFGGVLPSGEKCFPEDMTFTTKGYRALEKECRYISVKTKKDARLGGRLSSRGLDERLSSRGLVVTIKARCSGEAGGQFRDRFTVFVSTDKGFREGYLEYSTK